jgi:hypothetical protein
VPSASQPDRVTEDGEGRLERRNDVRVAGCLEERFGTLLEHLLAE